MNTQTADAPHVCPCGFTTWICRDEVAAEQWDWFERLHRHAYAWASEHLIGDDDPEVFAERFAGEFWADPEPPSYSAVYATELRARERQAEKAKAQR